MKLVETVIINWRRPHNVKKIVQALAEQTVPVTITICDCHNEEQYALDPATLSMADRVYRWTHNVGAYSRYTPLASYDHLYTFFIDDDLLPGKKCMEAYLEAAVQMPEFGVLGQFGRIIDADDMYRPWNLSLSDSFIETDFIIRAYFVKTRHLSSVVRFRWEIGYFDAALPEDDLLLCAALKYYEKLPCYLIPYNNDPETLVGKQEQNTDHALSARKDHYLKRSQFIERLKYYGWRSIKSSIGTKAETAPQFSVCMMVPDEWSLKQIYNWSCCYEIIIAGALENDFPDPENKSRYVSQRNEYAKLVKGTHVLVLEADEYYTADSLEKLAQDVIDNPDAEVFKFDFSHTIQKRTYYHLWKGVDKHIVGGYWDTPYNRIYKWTPGTYYKDNDDNPVHPDGRILHAHSLRVRCAPTRAVCIHAGFSNNMPLPHTATILPFTLPLPEALLSNAKMPSRSDRDGM